MGQYKADELAELYEELTGLVVADLEFMRDVIGGLPAKEKDLRQFCQHHLGLAGDELERAIQRIQHEELGEKSVPTPEGGELEHKATYGLKVFPRDAEGHPGVSDHQIKACLSTAATRLGIFSRRMGSKGDFREVGLARGHGPSVSVSPGHLRFYNGDGQALGKLDYHKLMGSPSGPKGTRSIVTDCEFAPAGSKLSIELRFSFAKLTESDIAEMFAFAQEIGLGSARSMQYGKFRVLNLDIRPNKRARKEEKTAKRGQAAS